MSQMWWSMSRLSSMPHCLAAVERDPVETPIPSPTAGISFIRLELSLSLFLTMHVASCLSEAFVHLVI